MATNVHVLTAQQVSNPHGRGPEHRYPNRYLDLLVVLLLSLLLLVLVWRCSCLELSLKLLGSGLEALDGLPEALPELWQLARPEDESSDAGDDCDLGEAQSEQAVAYLSASAVRRAI